MVLDNTTQYGVDHRYGTENLGDVFSMDAPAFDAEARFTPEQSPFLKDADNEYEEINARLDAMNSASTIANHETLPFRPTVEAIDYRMTPEMLNRKHVNEVVTYTKATYAWRHNALDDDRESLPAAA